VQDFIPVCQQDTTIWGCCPPCVPRSVIINWNREISQKPNLIQWQYVSELGDNVQLIILPSNSPFLFDLQQLVDQGQVEIVPTPIPSPTPIPEGSEQ
jgi:hypothetical protein